jgi:carbon monoxide dehydrogenase subunit G
MAIGISVGIAIGAPVGDVWSYVSRVERHVDWMADAESITFLTDQTRGAGTRMSVATAVGPLRTTDIMEFTDWDPPHRMAIRHEGLVTGEGAFTLEPYGAGTWFSWSETLSFPTHLGGDVIGLAAKPVLTAVWRRNLNRLARHFSTASPEEGDTTIS